MHQSFVRPTSVQLLYPPEESPQERYKRLSTLHSNMHSVVLIIFCVGHTFKVTTGICTPDQFTPTYCSPNVSDPRIGGRATCTFEERVNFDAARFPIALPEVKCKCPGSICSAKGDFRCVEVTSEFQVYHLKATGKTFGTVQLTTSCICATNMVLPDSKVTPDRVGCTDMPAAPLETPVLKSEPRNHSTGVWATIRQLQDGNFSYQEAELSEQTEGRREDAVWK